MRIHSAIDQEILEPKLRPRYIEKLNTLEKQKGIPFKNITELRKVVKNNKGIVNNKGIIYYNLHFAEDSFNECYMHIV